MICWHTLTLSSDVISLRQSSAAASAMAGAAVRRVSEMQQHLPRPSSSLPRDLDPSVEIATLFTHIFVGCSLHCDSRLDFERHSVACLHVLSVIVRMGMQMALRLVFSTISQKCARQQCFRTPECSTEYNPECSAKISLFQYAMYSLPRERLGTSCVQNCVYPMNAPLPREITVLSCIVPNHRQ